MSAQMTAQSSSDCGMAVKRERDTAIGTVARFTAIAAQQGRGKSAPIQKQDRLLALFQTIGNCLRQLFGQDSGFLFLSSFLPQIDDAHERHLFFIYALSERNEPVLPDRGVVIAFKRRRGASQNDRAFLDLRPHNCHIACLIPGRFLLLIGCLVFFIDHDEPKIF